MLWSINRPEWCFVQFGAALAGLVLVAASPSSRAHELCYTIQQSNSVGLIFARFRVDADDTAMIASVHTKHD
jgi:acyl-CoA synthetase (AMP-forming)/AMP-acid ligase II